MNPSEGTYRELERCWKGLRGTRGIRITDVPCDASDRNLLYVELGDEGGPAMSLAAGVHGDEPAGAWALFALVDTNALDPRCSYRIWPCTNPTGFAAGTRANADGVDVNRTFDGSGHSPEARAVLDTSRSERPVLTLDLHEDCDAEGFYCYEYGGGEVGRCVIAQLESRGFPIDPLDVTFGLAGPLDDAHCLREPGRVVADALREAALLGGLSYSLAMARAGVAHALTFETPLQAAWETRIAMHAAAVRTAIAAVLEESDSAPCN